VQLPFADEVRDPRALRTALVATFRRVIHLYFRDIERLGVPPASDTRGRVFVSNHTNALIDPVVVLTDAECEIAPVAKSTLWSIPGLSWLLDRAGAVPIVRRKDNASKDATANADVFDKIATHLGDGGNILIFPEGTSHSEPHLAPLRSGAARMLLAAEQRKGVPPTFQAVALEFDARHDFRSRCLVLWGPIRKLADVPGEGEDRVRAATSIMEADLKGLLVEGETHEDRLRIARVAELLATDAGDRTLGAWSDIGRQVVVAGRTLRAVDAGVVAQVAQHLDAYYAELQRTGLDDAQVAGRAELLDDRTPLSTWKRAALAPLAASGFALYAIPYFLPRWIARKADPDATSTIKLGAALVVYPLWAAGLVASSFALLPPPLSIAAAAIAVTSPFAALRWLDSIYQRRADASPDERARLMRLRITARTAIDEARSKLPS